MIALKRPFRVLALVTALSLAAPGVHAAGGLSEASALSAAGAGSIVAGSVMGLVGSAELVVEGVEWVADGVRCTLKGSAQVGRVVLLLPVKAAGGVSLLVGQTLVITTEASGWLITKAGEVIAFIPNELGRALLFSGKAGGS